MATIGILEITLLFMFLLVFHFLTKKFNKYTLTSWPILGMLPELLLQVHNFYAAHVEVLKHHKLNFMFKGPWLCNMNILMTCDPANVRHIMSANFSNYPKGHEFKDIFGDLMGDGIFNADDELWMNQRKFMLSHISEPKFYDFLVRTSQDKVKRCMVPVLDHVCDNGLVIDLQDLFQRYSVDSTFMTVSGYDPNYLSIEFPQLKFSEAVDEAEEAIFNRHLLPEIIWKLQKFLQIGVEKRLSEAKKTLDSYLYRIIEIKKQELCKLNLQTIENHEDFSILTAYMITGRHEFMGSKKPSDEFLKDSFMSLMFAGLDGISLSITWFFYEMTQNRGVEQKLREELESIDQSRKDGKEQRTRVFDVEEVKGLVHLHGAMCETLRLYPIIQFQHKKPIKKDRLPSGHEVNPNMKILFSLYAMGRMRSIWGEDCLEFKPERWIGENGKIKHVPSYKFFAFSSGPRSCIGKEISLIQMKTVAASILYNYNIEAVDGQTATPSLSIALHMKHGFNVRVSKRWSTSTY